jgi:hypothetical protein
MELLVLLHRQGAFIEFPFPPADLFFQQVTYYLTALTGRDYGLHPGI